MKRLLVKKLLFGQRGIYLTLQLEIETINFDLFLIKDSLLVLFGPLADIKTGLLSVCNGAEVCSSTVHLRLLCLRLQIFAFLFVFLSFFSIVFCHCLVCCFFWSFFWSPFLSLSMFNIARCT